MVKDYEVKLKSLINLKLNDQLYLEIKKFCGFRKHIENHKRDLKNRIIYNRKREKIKIMIFNFKLKKELDSKFTWSPELSETIINKYSFISL